MQSTMTKTVAEVAEAGKCTLDQAKAIVSEFGAWIYWKGRILDSKISTYAEYAVNSGRTADRADEDVKWFNDATDEQIEALDGEYTIGRARRGQAYALLSLSAALEDLASWCITAKNLGDVGTEDRDAWELAQASEERRSAR